MPSLLLKFRIHLDSDNFSGDHYHGPLFHRWLPDGETDALMLDTGNANADLKIWFERRGFVENGLIKYDHERQEVDSNVMAGQTVLEAGRLQGLLEIRDLSDAEATPLREHRFEEPLYKALGNRVVNDFLYPCLSRFIEVLRINYGQYWLPELESWDSRRHSLASYCRYILGLSWSLDGGASWHDFIPGEVVQSAEIRSHARYSQYLTKEDWISLGEATNNGYKPSLGAFVLRRSHEALDLGDLRYAFIEGIIALEVSVQEFLFQHSSKEQHNSLAAFFQLPLPTQLITVAAALGTVPTQDLEDSINTIKIRNKIVHDGADPSESARQQLSALLRTIALLHSGPPFKFPSIHKPGTVWKPPNLWEVDDVDQDGGPVIIHSRLDLSQVTQATTAPPLAEEEKGEEPRHSVET